VNHAAVTEGVVPARRRGARGVGVAGLLLAMLSCGGPALTTPSAVDCAAPIEPAGRHVLELEARVGRDAAGTCAEIGGDPVIVAAAGVLYTRATWMDVRARLRTEIWRGSFEQLVASGSPDRGAHCVQAQAAVSPGKYVIVTCHAPDSGVPIATRGDLSTYTPFHLTVVYP
jgi:hypothetical protein